MAALLHHLLSPFGPMWYRRGLQGIEGMFAWPVGSWLFAWPCEVLAVCMAPWGPSHMPGPTRAPPLPALFPEPPRFIKEPKDQIGVSGGVASFVCQATGDPKPRVTWNKKGKKVNSQRFEVSCG